MYLVKFSKGKHIWPIYALIIQKFYNETHECYNILTSMWNYVYI